jgi:polyisoprenoid-binding protein YceI
MPEEPAPQRLWDLDPAHTLVEFAAMRLGLTLIKGRFGGVRGTIRADESDLSRSSVAVEIDAASLDTGEPRRDKHLRSEDFLDVERFPSIRFASTRVEPDGPDRLRVHGELTIHGATRATVLETEIKGHGPDEDGREVAGFSAEVQIQRQDFGLTWNKEMKAGTVLVGNSVAIHLEVQAIRRD